MWEIDNLSQLLGFLYSVALGAVFCLVYDLFRAVRAEIKFGAAAVFAADILYSVICAVLCFCFLLSVTGGEIRFFVLAGAAVGFAVSRFTVSRILYFALTRTVRAVLFAFARISLVSGRFFALISRGFDFLLKKAKKICVFFQNTLKKYLKKQQSLLYTKRNRG